MPHYYYQNNNKKNKHTICLEAIHFILHKYCFADIDFFFSSHFFFGLTEPTVCVPSGDQAVCFAVGVQLGRRLGLRAAGCCLT